jgi:trigger factor
VKSTVETLSATRVRLAIEVPFDELRPSLQKAYREIGSQVTIPGFRRGKVPAAVIDQRIGRDNVLNEAVQEAIPAQIVAAVREHDVKTLGRPEVEITEFGDGEPLRFTAEVDVRPAITLPDPADIKVTVEPVVVDDGAVEEQVVGLQERFATLKTVERAAANGDYVQIDLAASVNGVEVEGGTASNVSHEVGSGKLLPGMDEVLVGMSAGDSSTFETQLVGGAHAGEDATVAVTVRSVKEKELPALDDDFAQLASEFDTLAELRGDVRERLLRVNRLEKLYSARDEALKALIAATEVPAPESVVAEEVASRKDAMREQLESAGASWEEYLEAQERTDEDIDAELKTSATEAVQAQLLLDAYADAEEISVSDDEFGHEIMHRAQRAGVAPQKYYDQLVRSGAAGVIYGDVRRGKTLATILERVVIEDTNGERMTLADLRGPADEHDDHDDHEGHDHD